MKKSLIALLVVLLILISAVYLFIPSRLVVSNVSIINASPQGLFRVMLNDSNWKKWWPGTVNPEKSNPSQLVYKDFTFIIKEKKINSINIDVSSNDLKTNTALNFFPINQDSIQLAWQAEIVSGDNLFNRISGYMKARKLKSNLSDLLGKMNAYYSRNENIYDHEIKNILVTDSILVSTHGESVNYPSTNFIYGLIDELHAFTKKQDVRETGLPMLNITTKDSLKYLVRVAIPVNKKVQDEGKIEYKWMMGRGHILISDVKGGPKTIDNTLLQMQNYILDYNRSVAAIPFQSLITDRRKETDTSKWTTRIFYPVM